MALITNHFCKLGQLNQRLCLQQLNQLLQDQVWCRRLPLVLNSVESWKPQSSHYILRSRFQGGMHLI